MNKVREGKRKKCIISIILKVYIFKEYFKIKIISIFKK